MKADEKECEQYLAAWDAYKAGDKKIVKFVPASGEKTERTDVE